MNPTQLATPVPSGEEIIARIAKEYPDAYAQALRELEAESSPRSGRQPGQLPTVRPFGN